MAVNRWGNFKLSLEVMVAGKENKMVNPASLSGAWRIFSHFDGTVEAVNG